MEVACPECNTKFSLDESRIPGPSAKVRCSRCQKVFQITREGQIVGPDWAPPVQAPPETPIPEEVQERLPAPRPPEGLTPAAREMVAQEAASIPPEAAAAGAPPTRRKRRGLWIAAIFLCIVLVGGLGWGAWQGLLPGPLSPLNDVAQRLKEKLAQGKPAAPPAASPPAAAPEAGAKTPAPTKVTPPPPPVTAQDLRDLPVDWAQAHYQGLVNVKGGGQLLVIQGEVMNKGKTARGPIRLKATLTDAQHRPVKEELVYAGSTFTDNELKTMSPEEIKGWLSKPGGRHQEQVLKPGKREPFTVVFFGVPDNLAETQSGFQIMVVEGPVAAD